MAEDGYPRRFGGVGGGGWNGWGFFHLNRGEMGIRASYGERCGFQQRVMLGGFLGGDVGWVFFFLFFSSCFRLAVVEASLTRYICISVREQQAQTKALGTPLSFCARDVWILGRNAAKYGEESEMECLTRGILDNLLIAVSAMHLASNNQTTLIHSSFASASPRFSTCRRPTHVLNCLLHVFAE